MDYEKAYKEAFAKAGEIHRNEDEKRFDMEWLFPELKESEDEKIRKALIRFHKSTIDIDGIKGADIIAWLEKQGEKEKLTHEDICKAYNIPDIGEFSDGYHTFNSLYKQRMVLFAVLVNTYKDKAWKSWKHEDGLDCFGGGWFIVGIDTPAGTYTYHYEAKDWDRFDCQILEKAKHWDGHDEFDVERLFSLISNVNKDEVIKCLINGMKFYYEDNEEATWGTEKFSMKVKDILSWLEKQDEQKPVDSSISKEEILYQLVQNGTITAFDYLYLTQRCINTESTKDYHDIDPHFGIPVEDLMSKKKTADKVEPIFNIGDVLCDKSCTTLNKKYQPIIEILDIRNGMYICNNCSFPISQQDEYELVTKKNEPQYAWSDEDEHRVEDTIYYLDTAKKHYACTIELDACIDWLKSLKDRIGG